VGVALSRNAVDVPGDQARAQIGGMTEFVPHR